METEASPKQMSKPTEETETETTMSEEQEQPLPEEVLVLHEDKEPDTDPLGTLSDTEVEAIYHRLSKSEQNRTEQNCFDTTENRCTFMTRWYQPTRRCAAQ